jgi:hypothetical protein
MDRRLKVELFEVIRRGYAAGETIQGLSRKHGVHRRIRRFAIVGINANWPVIALLSPIEAGPVNTSRLNTNDLTAR